MFHYVVISADPPVVLKPGFKVRFEHRPAVPEGTLIRADGGFDVVAKPLKLAKGARFSSPRDMTLDYYDLLALASDPATGLWTARQKRKKEAASLGPRALVDKVAARAKAAPANGKSRSSGRLSGARSAVRRAGEKLASLV